MAVGSIFLLTNRVFWVPGIFDRPCSEIGGKTTKDSLVKLVSEKLLKKDADYPGDADQCLQQLDEFLCRVRASGCRDSESPGLAMRNLPSRNLLSRASPKKLCIGEEWCIGKGSVSRSVSSFGGIGWWLGCFFGVDGWCLWFLCVAFEYCVLICLR